MHSGSVNDSKDLDGVLNRDGLVALGHVRLSCKGTKVLPSQMGQKTLIGSSICIDDLRRTLSVT